MLTKSLVDSIEMTASELSDYNASLEEEGIPSNLNEAFIESKLCELEQIGADFPENRKIYWLTFARLFELALLCAGNDADHSSLPQQGIFLSIPGSS